ncbi:hypothetical protein SVIOM342S_03274 [Streptomyces violaceorubidus]
MIGQRGIRTGSKGAPVRYEAIGTALGHLAEKAAGLEASVHMPRIGCGLRRRQVVPRGAARHRPPRPARHPRDRLRPRDTA